MNVFKTVKNYVAFKQATSKLTSKEIAVITEQYLQDNENVLTTIRRIEELCGEKITSLLEWLRFINRNTRIGWNEENGIRDYVWHATIKDVKRSKEQGVCCVELIDYPEFPIMNRNQYQVVIKSWVDGLKFNRMVKEDLKRM